MSFITKFINFHSSRIADGYQTIAHDKNLKKDLIKDTALVALSFLSAALLCNRSKTFSLTLSTATSLFFLGLTFYYTGKANMEKYTESEGWSPKELGALGDEEDEVEGECETF